MKNHLALCWLCAALLGCCANRYCDPSEIGRTLERAAFRQIGSNARATCANVRALGEFWARDLRESPDRIGKTARIFYGGVSFERSGESLSRLGDFFANREAQASEDLQSDLRSLAQAFCLCGSE